MPADPSPNLLAASSGKRPAQVPSGDQAWGRGGSPAAGKGLAEPRAAIHRMAAYAPPPSASMPITIKLDANENPYGPSPRVREALARFEGYHRYPDPDQKALRALVGEYVDVSPDLVVVGHGSDELIDLLCRLYLEAEDEVMDCTPTFGMYRFSAELCGGYAVEAPRDQRWGVDVGAVGTALSPRTKLIFVASPNNPTGNQAAGEVIRELLETGCVVVLDEAYGEFSDGGSWCQRVGQYSNLVVLRTFSKWAGLAGMRVGYGVFPGEIARHLWKIKPPFNVHIAAEAAIRATLEDLPLLRERVGWIVRERERMAQELRAVPGFRVWPSQANFLLVQVPGGDGAALGEHLAARGIGVRTYAHPRLRDAVRISVGLPEHTDALVAAVQEWAQTGRKSVRPEPVEGPERLTSAL